MSKHRETDNIDDLLPSERQSAYRSSSKEAIMVHQLSKRLNRLEARCVDESARETLEQQRARIRCLMSDRESRRVCMEYSDALLDGDNARARALWYDAQPLFARVLADGEPTQAPR